MAWRCFDVTRSHIEKGPDTILPGAINDGLQRVTDLVRGERARAPGFILMFTCDSIARSILISLIPLQAYALLGAAQIVSVVYFLVAVLGLLCSLAVPLILHHVPRRQVLTAAALAQIASIILLGIGTKVSLITGLCLQAIALSAMDVVINLYLLEHIPRRELSHFEPLRLVFAGTAFAAGPWLGIFLQRNVADYFTYLVAAVSMSVMLLYFRAMRLADAPLTDAQSAPTPNPIGFVRRYMAQPRLVLAWLLAFGRNGWWVSYFIYMPIYVASSGYSPQTGGALVSLGLAPMLAVRVWARIGQIVGVRNLLTFGYGVNSLCSLLGAAAAFAGYPRLCMGLICCAALFATMVDGAGNVPFLRAVHPYERVPMTSVFMTFRQMASLTVPGILALVLWVLPLPAAFAVGGLITLVMAGLSRYLPRGM
jgi:MFS family permease